MAQFRPLSSGLLLPAEEIGEDVKYWKNFESHYIHKKGDINHVEFSPVKPHNVLSTSSLDVIVHKYSPPHSESLSLKGFSDLAYSGSYRQDGQLIVAGSKSSDVYVFKTKIALRNFVGHKGEVHVTRFTGSNFNIFSGSDDNTVRYWDLATGSQLICFEEHTDYVRSGAASLANKEIFATGSYDRTVKLFDARTQSSVLTMDHGAPVTSVLIHPTGGLVISAGGNYIKIWDTVGGGRVLETVENHHKTITALCYSNNYQRLVSASLDRHVKFYDVKDYKVVNTLNYSTEILSLAIAPDDSAIAAGMRGGLLSIQRRKEEVEVVKKRKLRPGSEFFSSMVKKDLVLNRGDHLLEHKRKQHLEEYDKYFRRFEYGKALDTAMSIRSRRKSPETTIAVIRELIRRGALRSSLAGRQDASVADILKFLSKNYCMREFQDTIVDVINIVVDLYGDRMAFMAASLTELEKIKNHVDTMIEAELRRNEVAASLLAIVAASNQIQRKEVDLKRTDCGHRTEENNVSMDVDQQC